MAEKTKDGIELWEKVEKSNTAFLKRVKYGKRTFTAIDAYYQIKIATSLWGPYGSTWGLKDTEVELHTIGELTMAMYKAVFYSPAGEFEIRNSIKVSDDEFMKKLETDTLTKALSRLGFNADVFLGYYDGNRYVDKQSQPSKSQTTQQTKPQSQPAQKQETKPQSQAQSKTDDSLEILKKSGVVIKNTDGRLIATGKTYQNSSLLKKLGFKWNAEQKVWVKESSKAA